MYKMQLRLLHFVLFFLILAGCKPPCHIALSSSSTMPSPPPLSFLSWNNPCSRSDGLPPIVICHGLLGQAKNFQTLGELLASSHPKRGVYALDMRNHGPHHNRWRSTMTYTEMAGDVVEWMDWCGLPKAVFIGHSMGGKVVMNLAASKGGRERVAGLVVLDIAPVEYRSNDGTSWELINGIIDACASLPLDEVASKKVRTESPSLNNQSSLLLTTPAALAGGGELVQAPFPNTRHKPALLCDDELGGFTRLRLPSPVAVQHRLHKVLSARNSVLRPSPLRRAAKLPWRHVLHSGRAEQVRPCPGRAGHREGESLGLFCEE